MKLLSEWFAPERLLWNQTIYGAPVSMKNRRIPLKLKTGVTKWIRSRDAQLYERDFIRQARRPLEPISAEIILCLKIFYKNRRPDLDEALIMDCLQSARIIRNDRQIRFKIIDGLAFDPKTPRVEIEIYLAPALLIA